MIMILQNEIKKHIDTIVAYKNGEDVSEEMYENAVNYVQWLKDLEYFYEKYPDYLENEEDNDEDDEDNDNADEEDIDQEDDIDDDEDYNEYDFDNILAIIFANLLNHLELKEALKPLTVRYLMEADEEEILQKIYKYERIRNKFLKHSA